MRRLVRFGVEAQEEPLLRLEVDRNAAGEVGGGPDFGISVRNRAAGGGVGETVAAFRDVPFEPGVRRLPRAQVDEKQQLEVAAVDDLDVAEPRGGVSVSFEDGVPPRAARGEGVEERRDGFRRIGIEADDSLVLIDQHAAHERLQYEKFMAQLEAGRGSQQLLTPLVVRLSAREMALILDNIEVLRDAGYEVEPFGETDYVVRALPADLDAADVAPAVEEICEKLRRGKAPRPEDARDEILHTVACKAAIKAGWDTDPMELRRVAEAVLSGKVKYCPHGRPVSAVLSRRELDKLFKRIV